MTVSILMYDKGLEHIGQRLEALGLDIEVATFDKSCTIMRGGQEIAPAVAQFDYVWLSSGLTRDGIQEQAFALVESIARVDVMQTYNAGLDHPFYKRMAAKGTRICNSSAQGVAIAEYTLGQVLSVMQPVAEQRALQAAKTWKITPFQEISQTSWLVVGYGPIGREITKRVKAFGARVAVVRRSTAPSGEADVVTTPDRLQDHLPDADVVVLACPLTKETQGMADSRFFAAMKEGTILVNVARGALINDPALLAALETPKIATAILDVFAEEPLPAANPFWSHPKIRLTSHTSFAGSGVRARWDALFLDNIARFARGEALVNEVPAAALA
ncbi:MAG: NAD(P)-dependent oxidoreductase [Hyphomicrobiaceae bacterium]